MCTNFKGFNKMRQVNLYHNVVFEKVMAKLLTLEELETVVSETGCYSNSRPLTFLDEDLSYIF